MSIEGDIVVLTERIRKTMKTNSKNRRQSSVASNLEDCY